MARRTNSQKIGAQGHKWFSAFVEHHEYWLSRELNEDYGVDLELELTKEGMARGEILKVQIKSKSSIRRSNKCIDVNIERKYLEYASSCRYPVILVIVDVTESKAWYIWLQRWLLEQRSKSQLWINSQNSWTYWIPEDQTVEKGLSGELISIAQWEGETQLCLSLLDAMRSAAATRNPEIVRAIVDVITISSAQFGHAVLVRMIEEAAILGQRLRGSKEGNTVADMLFAMAEKFGGSVTCSTVHELVIRGDSFSRVGIAVLAVLYDHFHQHIKSLSLAEYFKSLEPRVAYYCAFREAFPSDTSILHICKNPQDFQFSGIKFVEPENYCNLYANRGPSAILECLELCDD